MSKKLTRYTVVHTDTSGNVFPWAQWYCTMKEARRAIDKFVMEVYGPYTIMSQYESTERHEHIYCCESPDFGQFNVTLLNTNSGDE